MNCEMCGKTGQMFRAKVEGTDMNVCESCSSFGKIIKKIVVPKLETKKAAVLYAPIDLKPKTEIIQTIVPNYYTLIRNKREKMGLTQEDFAKKVNERMSLLSHIERGEMEPSITLARKLELLLGLKLIDEKEISLVSLGSRAASSQSMTLGDMIQVKKR